MTPHPLILARLRDEVRAVCQLADGTCVADAPPPAAVFPGSFNPLHHGHRTLAAAAAARLGAPVHFELSAANVDKPDLTPADLAGRLAQFVAVGPVWVTRAAAFEKKADLFPGAAFVLGYDTAARLIDPRYYGDSPARRDAALRKLLDRGCRVVVGGRVGADGRFREWDPAGVAAEFAGLFDAIPEAAFRADVSSTALRRAAI